MCIAQHSSSMVAHSDFNNTSARRSVPYHLEVSVCHGWRATVQIQQAHRNIEQYLVSLLVGVETAAFCHGLDQHTRQTTGLRTGARTGSISCSTTACAWLLCLASCPAMVCAGALLKSVALLGTDLHKL